MRTGAEVGSRQLNYVSAETRARFENPTMMLSTRSMGERVPTGAVFLFSVNPTNFTYTQSARTSVQDTRGGYVVTESGMGAPHFKLSGNFGWRTRKINLADFTHAGAGSARYLPRLGQQYQDYGEGMNDTTRGGFVDPTPGMAERSNTQVSSAGSFELDGQQAWHALRDYILWYSENNEQRVREGKRPMEMLLHDTLHRLRWVVAPLGAPSLEHTADAQGVTPYQLELVGVYDDTRPVGRRGGGLPALWEDVE